MNKRAFEQLKQAEAKELVIIPGATHLFEEPGKIEEVAKASIEWFNCYLLENGKQFVNRYNEKIDTFFPRFKNKHMLQIRFRDRLGAGEILVPLLRKYKYDNPVIIGVARGGMVVANVIARKLSCDLDVIIPRRLRSPINSEVAIGALLQDGFTYLDKNLVKSLNLSGEYIETEKLEQKKEIDRRSALYRTGNGEYQIKGRTVILVDDGAATGSTLIVCTRWVKKQEPRKIVIAVPVAPRGVIELLGGEANRTEVIRSTSTFKSVDQFYQDYDIVTDQEVVDIMKDRNY